MKTVDVPAGTIEYADSGSGPPVVLLHGLLMNHTLWDRCLPHLPSGFRYLRPVLPLGSHRTPMRETADLTLGGQVQLVADLLDALNVEDATLVHADWGGGLFLTARGRDERVARQIVLPCEAFGNFPPGLPGKMAALAARVPGGINVACRQLRVGWMRRTPLLMGQMARRPLDDALIRGWTDPALRDPQIRRDLVAYARTKFDKDALIRDTEALRRFKGEALVIWSPDNKVMPPEHGRLLADLFTRSTYVEVPDAYVLSMLDEPEAVALHMAKFLAS